MSVCVCVRLQTGRVVRCGPWTDGRWCHFFLFALSWPAGEVRAAICNAHLPDHTHTHTHTRLMTHCHSMTTTPAAYKHSCHKCKSPSLRECFNNIVCDMHHSDMLPIHSGKDWHKGSKRGEKIRHPVTSWFSLLTLVNALTQAFINVD